MSGLDFVDFNFKMRMPSGGSVVNFQSARFTTAKANNRLYNAWLASDGAYIIMERDFTALTTKYFFRARVELDTDNNLDGDWGVRTALTYVEYSALFS